MHILFPGPAGQLEGELWDAPGQAVPAVACAFCHPHPLYGGSMRSKVVFRAARGLQSAGCAVLRFNFRGVGQSAGSHDGRGAEEQDLAAALDELARRFPGAELWAAGFSFGARTAAGLALSEQRIRRLVLIGLPVLRFDCAPLRALATEGLLVLAGQDIYGKPQDLEQRLPELSRHMECSIFPEAGHFFENQTHELEAQVERYAQLQLQAKR